MGANVSQHSIPVDIVIEVHAAVNLPMYELPNGRFGAEVSVTVECGLQEKVLPYTYVSCNVTVPNQVAVIESPNGQPSRPVQLTLHERQLGKIGTIELPVHSIPKIRRDEQLQKLSAWHLPLVLDEITEPHVITLTGGKQPTLVAKIYQKPRRTIKRKKVTRRRLAIFQRRYPKPASEPAPVLLWTVNNGVLERNGRDFNANDVDSWVTRGEIRQLPPSWRERTHVNRSSFRLPRSSAGYLDKRITLLGERAGGPRERLSFPRVACHVPPSIEQGTSSILSHKRTLKLLLQNTKYNVKPLNSVLELDTSEFQCFPDTLQEDDSGVQAFLKENEDGQLCIRKIEPSSVQAMKPTIIYIHGTGFGISKEHLTLFTICGQDHMPQLTHLSHKLLKCRVNATLPAVGTVVIMDRHGRRAQARQRFHIVHRVPRGTVS